MVKEEDFDKEVESLNESLFKIEKRKSNFLMSFLERIGSILNLYEFPKYKSPKREINLYERTDISSKQKDLIVNASDWKRITSELEEIIKGEKTSDYYTQDEAIYLNKIAKQIYEAHKQEYHKLSSK